MDYNIQMYKATLASKSYKQTQNVNFNETLSLIVMIKSIKILFTIVANHDYKIQQIDVKTTFLDENSHEYVHLTQPEGFEFK